ncbi:hypothetical protein N7460_004142 [Penicillium canescens]|uniref:Uncharacterized protein n=1 Tax=Penicillium canescens TaxID=5083 RepID=A0AAD6IIA2_PENCN|nr:hypothetical protein N7460_004142 [Penicillium canescens]
MGVSHKRKIKSQEQSNIQPNPPLHIHIYPIILIIPKAALTTTPTKTATPFLQLQTPSSLLNHIAHPIGQKNPITAPHSISSIASRDPAPMPPSSSPPPIPSPPPATAAAVDPSSIHRSSRSRS